jgi:hypothetical protein
MLHQRSMFGSVLYSFAKFSLMSRSSVNFTVIFFIVVADFANLLPKKKDIKNSEFAEWWDVNAKYVATTLYCKFSTISLQRKCLC